MPYCNIRNYHSIDPTFFKKNLGERANATSKRNKKEKKKKEKKKKKIAHLSKWSAS